MKMSAGMVLLAFSQTLAGCAESGSSSVPTAPSPAIQLVVFTDRVSGFSTSDVRDAQEQIVQFNTAGELIWTADGTRFPGYPVIYRNFIRADRSPEGRLEVVFGTEDGDRRAYLTFVDHHQGYYTIVDIEVVDGQLVITETNVPLPRT